MNGFLTFLILSLFVVMSPGIDTALITKTTILLGKKAGFKMAFGISTGSLIHTCAAALGLSALLLKSAMAFEVVKFLGAAYLLYLGIQAFWLTREKKQDHKGQRIETDQQNTKKLSSPYKQGLLSNALNPKVAIFFLTFLPQFINPKTNAMNQLFIMGFVYTLFAITWFLVYVYFVNYFRKWLLTPKTKKIMERMTGAVLIGFGLNLIFEKR